MKGHASPIHTPILEMSLKKSGVTRSDILLFARRSKLSLDGICDLEIPEGKFNFLSYRVCADIIGRSQKSIGIIENVGPVYEGESRKETLRKFREEYGAFFLGLAKRAYDPRDEVNVKIVIRGYSHAPQKKDASREE